MDKKRQHCAGCGRDSPEVQTNYTLIGDSHGWRSAVVSNEGKRELTWYCPECWRKRKGGEQSKRS